MLDTAAAPILRELRPFCLQFVCIPVLVCIFLRQDGGDLPLLFVRVVRVQIERSGLRMTEGMGIQPYMGVSLCGFLGFP